MLIANAQNMYDKAQAAGCTNQMEVSLERLQKCKESVAQVESSVAEVKEKERIRQEELRKQKEEEKRRAEEEAKKRAEEEKRRAEEEAKKRAEEEAKRRAEEAKRNSPEYCIENNLELTSIALNEVIRDLTFHSNTGNKIYDKAENARRHARFMGKIITVSGTINKVQLTAFTREVKIIVSVPGGTISARFDGMPRSEAAQFRVGQSIKFSGQISNRPVLSTFAMDRCSIR
jgi:vacuolar-type H+-ATPase subunit I/STV1